MTPTPEQSEKNDTEDSYPQLHHKTAGSDTAALLREAPRTSIELPDGESTAGTRNTTLRDIVCRLSAPSTRSQAKKRPGPAQSVYYLYGDERRAVRTFIDENEEYVRSCLGDTPNPLAADWDGVLYQLLREEWDFRTAEEGKS